MHITVTSPIDAAPEQIWSVISDVTSWAEWTASITSIERLDDGPLSVGSRVKIRQPGFPAVEWTVTELVEGASFTWQARSPGLLSTGTHTVRSGIATPEVELSISQTGALAPLMRLLFGRKSRRFVQMEADGLRQHCEQRAATPS
jgi:uncharacterized membrane protein